MATTTVPLPLTPVPHSLPSQLKRIVLTGFMGAGKTTAGRRLAAALHWDFLDIDALLEERHGSTIADIFNTHGEDTFRRFESHAIAHALGHRNTVIALGGGAPEVLTNRLLLEQTPATAVVFLDAGFPALFDRCMLQPDAAVRPNLADPVAAEARFRARLPLYRRIARITVATEGKTPDETVITIQERLQNL
ncbi:shikimate kinase [Terriglobus saanensis]|uniref:Shikimate kinase n=1 Tax=Terriglobus saanensis (strain ATCC BAA-1853 / DSM 23119 / SP1PR4) TaxID=401053 RepID=E8V7P2_TERSS|nr:shikimate kinase [Terriglobus saanensis]ADV81740.1 Shikimate kinase [Terriglobus saanensis SP1PR4]